MTMLFGNMLYPLTNITNGTLFFRKNYNIPSSDNKSLYIVEINDNSYPIRFTCTVHLNSTF